MKRSVSHALWLACLALAFGCAEKPLDHGASEPAAPVARPGEDANEPPAKRAPEPKAPPVDHGALAKEILSATGVRGGLVVISPRSAATVRCPSRGTRGGGSPTQAI